VLRDAAGHCERVALGQVGEAIAEIHGANVDGRERAGAGQFEGYADPLASEQKTLRDVFVPGDAWYRSGDLMRQDAQGFFYFVDRIGDTFRWKGENVSTSEVSAVLQSCPGILEAAVYGVSVPGSEGRAGMAALVTSVPFDLSALPQALAAALPDYARPQFLRLVTTLPTTGTLKLDKQVLMTQGYDPERIDDPMYFLDRAGDRYLPLDAPLYERLLREDVRL
jgi:fatty-acyl-CoA synthase